MDRERDGGKIGTRAEHRWVKTEARAGQGQGQNRMGAKQELEAEVVAWVYNWDI